MMNTALFRSFAFLAILCFSTTAKAQNIITTCGTDTVTLKAFNHQFGTLEWEKSYDNQAWVKIPNAQDTIYQFLPTEAAYYRVVNKLPYCDPTISSVTQVLFPPQASAGVDRIAVDDFIFLQGNSSLGATYSWSILEGQGGEIVDADSRTTQFNGSHVGVNGSDGHYTLLYTLENACGTSTDTMKIEFVTNVWYDDIVIVDDTDEILSTPAQIENGQYIITFSSPVPNITNQTILLGIQDEGFMRKVVQITQNGNTFDMMTEQAKIDELILSGGLDMAHLLSVDPIDETIRSSIGEEKFLTEKPTRQQLQSEARFQNPNAVHYYFEQLDIEEEPGVTFSRGGNSNRSNRSGNVQWNYDFDNKVLLDNNGLKVTLDGGLTLTPNFVSDVTFGILGGVEYANFALNHAQFDFNSKLTIEGEVSSSFEQSYTLLTIPFTFYVVVGGFAIPINAKVELNADLGLNAQGSFEYTYEYEKKYETISSLIYTPGKWREAFWERSQSSSEQNYNAQVSAAARIDIGPKITLSIADLDIGAYMDIRMTSDLTACASTQNNEDFNWGLNLDLGAKMTLGVDASLFKTPIVDKSHTWEKRNLYNDRFPYYMEYWAGNNQQYTIGEPTENTIKVRVMSKQGYIIPGAFVVFEPLDGGGTVSDPFVITNSSGIAQTSWTPTSSSLSRVRAWVKDCEFNYISYAPLVFTATENIPDNDCSETTLSASNLVVDDNLTIIPHLGVPPYTYSSDLVNFSSSPVQVSMQPNMGYSMAIKDAAGCLAHTFFLNTEPECETNPMQLSFDIYGTHGFTGVSGGIAPHTYQLNAETPTTNNFFTGLPFGTHTMTVTDATLCQQTSTFQISGSTDNIVAFFMTPDSVDFGATVSPINLSINATSYNWNFGNGQSSTAASPSITYSSGGDYLITLTVMNGFGTHEYSKQISVVGDPNILIDINGNSYNVTQIGNQIWMAENLKVHNLNDGTPLQEASGIIYWEYNQSPAYTVLPIAYSEEYGYLYNFHSVNTNSLCPTGWHVPTISDWEILIDFLQGEGYWNFNFAQGAGNSLKSCRQVNSPAGVDCNTTQHPRWDSSTNNGFDVYGFNGTPAGRRDQAGTYANQGKDGFFWSSNANISDPNLAHVYALLFNQGGLLNYNANKSAGFSVRCIKD